MQWYSWSREDYLDLLINRYTMKEEIWCLGIGQSDKDYVLCDGDEELLPTLYKKDEIRFEYNQGNQDWSRNSCTIFAAAWMYSDLTNYGFSLKELKEMDDSSYQPWFEHQRVKWQWWYVKDAVDCVRKYVNGRKDLVEKYWKVASYRISKYSDDVIESVLDKLYTIDGNHGLNSDYTKDKADWMIDGTDFWYNSNWHSVDVINYKGQRSVKNSYKGVKNNIYGLRHKLSEITNFWPYFYVFTLVNEDNLEEIKRLNEIKSECNLLIEHLGKLWHLVNDTNFQGVLHYTAEKLRKKIADANEQLLKLNKN